MVIRVLMRHIYPVIMAQTFVLCMLDKSKNFQYICNQHHYEKLCHIILINRCGVVDFM